MKLGLGTVQFGLDYGITNKNGQLPSEEAKKVLSYAKECGIKIIDTAAIYGDAEAVLGSCLPEKHEFLIVTKTIPIKKSIIEVDHVDQVLASFKESLVKLKQTSIYALLVHAASDLLNPGGELIFELLKELKYCGLIKKIGASVYSTDEAIKLLDRYEIDVIQLPLSLFDQRFIADGTIFKLHNHGIEIHARSVFLQGVLLSPEGTLPSNLLDLSEIHSQYWKLLKDENISPLSATLGFVDSIPEIDFFLVGVNSLNQLVESKLAYDKKSRLRKPEILAVKNSLLINPNLWL